MAPNAEMMKKFQDPQFQARMKKARQEGRLEKFLKEEGLKLPPQMLEAMKRMSPGGSGAAGGPQTSASPGGEGSRGGAPREGRAQRPNSGSGGGAGGEVEQFLELQLDLFDVGPELLLGKKAAFPAFAAGVAD